MSLETPACPSLAHATLGQPLRTQTLSLADSRAPFSLSCLSRSARRGGSARCARLGHGLGLGLGLALCLGLRHA
eukprot:12246958-Alexandrium_andersonii.AAC.1